jgi:hypothetical protein
MYAGDSKFNRRLDRVCGDSITFDTTSTGETMLVEFKTDMTNSFPGFLATWTSGNVNTMQSLNSNPVK